MDHNEFSKINLYICLSTLPSILYHAPSPKAVMHLQIATNPSSCFTVRWTCWGPVLHSPSPIQNHDLPFELNLFIFVLSLKITHFQSSMVQFHTFEQTSSVREHVYKNGFLCCTCALNPTSLKARLTVMSNNNIPSNEVVLLLQIKFQLNLQ